VKLFVEGILKLKLLKLGYKGLMATVEEGADGKNIKPVVKVYSRRQLGKMLRKFSSVKFHIRHLKANHTPKISDQSRLDRLEKKYGWYIIAEAVK
jgi:hypothetical protein